MTDQLRACDAPPGRSGAARRDGPPSVPDLWRERLKSALLKRAGTTVAASDTPGAIALTFDDGPDRAVTPAMLDVLARHGAKATFFVLTDHALAHRDLIARILGEGHEVGLHFDRHDRIPDLPPLEALRRMHAARRLLARLTGRPVPLFRPPYGGQSYLTYWFARLLRLEVVAWNQAAFDWLEQGVESSVRSATETLAAGDIVLLHDGLALGPDEPRPSLDRAEVADRVLQEAARRGLTSTTVGDLLARGRPQRRRWFK